MNRLRGKVADGTALSTTTPEVTRYLDEWFAANQDGWRAATRRSYRGAIDHYLKPAFAGQRLEAVTPQRVQRWLTTQATEHGARRRITLAHATLRSALSEAKRLQLVSINAAQLCRVPKSKARTITPLDVEQAGRFLTAARGNRLEALFCVALACGLRLGEASGLRWDDVDLDTGELRVRQQLQAVAVPDAEGKQRRVLVLQELKTAKSRRTLVLPAVSLDTMRARRTQQREERLKAGARWSNADDVVFTTRSGAAIDPRNILRTFHALLKSAGLERRRFHDLRHSAASLLIAQGVELIEVSMLLGHSETRTTGDLYSHLVKQTAAKAASHMDAILRPSPKSQGVK